jgi:transcriptional regulator with XRE-family HTH domain
MSTILTPQQLKQRRQERGVSQAELARELNIQRAYISQFENGKYMFADDDLTSIAEFLEDLELVNEIDDMEPVHFPAHHEHPIRFIVNT